VLAEYFAQDQYKVLNPEARMLDDISATAPKIAQTELRSLLGCFLFSGDDAFKKLGVLSGGERNRYALARILVSPANFLLLDEPTNHLDLRAKDVLLEAVSAFSGTVIFVSHDRYFIDRVATRVFEVEGSHVHVYPGNYEDYLYRKESGQALSGAPPSSNGFKRAVETAPEPTPEPVKEVKDVKRVNPIKLKQMQDRFWFLEEDIPRLETSIAATEAALGNFTNAAETQRLTRELEELRSKHAEFSEEWGELMEQLEAQSAVN